MSKKEKKQSLEEFANTEEGRELTAEELKQVIGGALSIEPVDIEQLSSNPRLETEDTDNTTVSYVIGGKTYTTTFTASGVSIGTLFEKEV